MGVFYGFIFTENEIQQGVVLVYSYPKSHKPKSMAEQIRILQSHYPDLELPASIPTKVPAGAEGLFAIPNIWTDRKTETTYQANVRAALFILAKLYANGLCSGLGECSPFRYADCDSITERSEAHKQMQELSAEQNHPDILIMGAQLGKRYRGQNAARARSDIDRRNHLHLGVFAVTHILITHPDRLQDYEDLWMRCTGDDYTYDGKKYVPTFWEEDAAIRLSFGYESQEHDYYGTVSGIPL